MAQGLGLGLLCCAFKEVQEDFPSEEASALEIVSVAFPMHHSTSPSLSQTIWLKWATRQFLSLPIVQTLLPVTFGYSLSSESVVLRQLRRWKRLWRRSLTRSHKRISVGPSRSCWKRYNKCIAAGGDYFEGDKNFMCVLSIKAPIRKMPGNLFNYPRIYIYIYIYIYILKVLESRIVTFVSWLIVSRALYTRENTMII